MTCGGRAASYVCTVADVLGEDLERDGLGVVPLLPLKDSTAGLKTEGKEPESRLNRSLGSSSTAADQLVNKCDFFTISKVTELNDDGGGENIYLLMSADHLSLCSSELPRGRHRESEGRFRLSICLLSYVTAAGTHMHTHKHAQTRNHTHSHKCMGVLAVCGWTCAAIFTPKPLETGGLSG